MTAPTSERTAFRVAVAKRDAPHAMVWIGIAILVLSFLNQALGLAQTPLPNILHAAVASLFLVAAAVLGRSWVPAAVVPWAIAFCSLAIVGSLQLEVWLDPTALGMAYVLMSMLAFGPFTLSPLAMSAAAAPMFAGCVLVARNSAPMAVTDWVAAALAALVIGWVLLRVRLRGIDELGEATALARAVAVRDPLTGVLNRRGIDERTPALVALAARQGLPVFVSFVDIDGLKAANDAFGHDFGDEIIAAVADAVRSVVRTEDLVGRWGGDEFIIVGIGQDQGDDEFRQRLVRRLRAGGIEAEKWSGEVSTGTASAEAGAFKFDDIVRRADADMYAGRRHRRGMGESQPGSSRD